MIAQATAKPISIVQAPSVFAQTTFLVAMAFFVQAAATMYGRDVSPWEVKVAAWLAVGCMAANFIGKLRLDSIYDQMYKNPGRQLRPSQAQYLAMAARSPMPYLNTLLFAGCMGVILPVFLDNKVTEFGRGQELLYPYLLWIGASLLVVSLLSWIRPHPVVPVLFAAGAGFAFLRLYPMAPGQATFGFVLAISVVVGALWVGNSFANDPYKTSLFYASQIYLASIIIAAIIYQIYSLISSAQNGDTPDADQLASRFSAGGLSNPIGWAVIALGCACSLTGNPTGDTAIKWQLAVSNYDGSGSRIVYKGPGMMRDDRILMPLDMCANVGVKVLYDSERRIVVLHRQEDNLVLKADSRYILVTKGSDFLSWALNPVEKAIGFKRYEVKRLEMKMPPPRVMEDGRLGVPLRFVFTVLGHGKLDYERDVTYRIIKATKKDEPSQLFVRVKLPKGAWVSSVLREPPVYKEFRAQTDLVEWIDGKRQPGT